MKKEQNQDSKHLFGGGGGLIIPTTIKIKQQ